MVNASLEPILEALDQVRREIAKVVLGQEQVIDLALIAIITNQHALIEGVPGVAKTLLVRTLAKVMGADYSRIQFTPDLMPTDITGSYIYNMKDGSFKLVPGPIFTTFLLADEINRAPAKTQSALLQAMQERRVTIDRDTMPLPENFTVFATQNPIEYEGTYPLPEAQRDRFMLKIVMGLPKEATEIELAKRTLQRSKSPEKVLDSDAVAAVLKAEQLAKLRNQLEHIVITDEMVQYLVQLIRETRNHDSVLVGAGPRATQALLLGVRAHAAISQRDYVTPEDVKRMFNAVLGHRIVLRPEFEIEGVTVEETLSQILEAKPVPR
jgi:MoxR-like ATPase